MGHYASEMDSNWGPSIERTNRIENLKKKIGVLSLGDFRVDQIVLLDSLFSTPTKLSDKDIDELEKAWYRIGMKHKHEEASGVFRD